PAPARQRPGKEILERLVPTLPHPVRLVLVRRNRGDQLVREPSSRLEEVVLRFVRVREPVLGLVVGADPLDNLGLCQCHHKPPQRPKLIPKRKTGLRPLRTRRTGARVPERHSHAPSEYPAHAPSVLPY